MRNHHMHFDVLLIRSRALRSRSAPDGLEGQLDDIHTNPGIHPRELVRLEVNVSRSTILNEAFIDSRWLPGMTTLCAVLTAESP